MNKPIIIVVTPIRNEAWILDAYLTCTSSWADYIILADQHSNDGSREIAAKYEKVILVDNNLPEMNQAAARELLFREVDKIDGDKVVLALDADEFLSEGFDKTEGWKRILQSGPNEIFCFQWLNLYGDYHHSVPNDGYMEWGCHFASTTSIADEYVKCERRSVHEMRVPCLASATYININDIAFIHLARLNLDRQKNKEAFYQVSSVAKLQKRMSAVSLFRTYNFLQFNINTMKRDVVLYVRDSNLDARDLVKKVDAGQYYIDEMVRIFERDGYKKYLKLDIWDNPYLIERGINPKEPLIYRLLFSYLRKTQPKADCRWVQLMDKVLRRII